MRRARGPVLRVALGGAMLASLASLALAAAFSCGIYDGSLLLPATDAGTTTPDVNAPTMEASTTDGSASTCAHVAAPARPTTADDTSKEVDLVVAGSYVRFSRSGAPAVPTPPRGIDLDHQCTCPGPESCTPIGSSAHCDGEGGTDDGIGALFDLIGTIAPGSFSDTALNYGISQGDASILFRVRSYNGTLNDPSVILSVYSSNGLIDHAGGAGTAAPKLDGTDIWTVNPITLVNGASIDAGTSCDGNDSACVPLYVDPQAYVANGVLVAHLDFPISFGTKDSTIVAQLTQTTVMGTLTTDPNGLVHIDDGQITGRWRTSNLLSTLSSVHDPYVPGGFLCGDSGVYQEAKGIFCSGADIRATPSEDNTGLRCDAVSAAIGFAAVAANLGPTYQGTTPTAGCGASYSDDCP